jgi:ribosomal protein S12 methylthiotransferase accessory factor
MTIDVIFDGNKKINARVGKHIIKTDQPVAGGGEDSAPSPFELFLASIATCAGIYVKGFCDNRGISVEGMKISQIHEFDEKGLVTDIRINIKLPDGFPEKYIDSVINVANLCKVKQTLASPPKISVIASTNECC